MLDFNKILHQQCNIELQTSHKMSVKPVNNCNSYSGFSADTQKMKCPLQAMAQAIKCQTASEEISNNRPAKSLCLKCPPHARMQARRR